MSDVFISYAREDRGLAKALAKGLQEMGSGGILSWLHQATFQDVILAALSRAKAAIVVWTKELRASSPAN